MRMLARDKGRCAGGKEYDHARHFHWVTNSVKRGNTLDHVRAELGIGKTALRPRSTDKCGCDRIHSDVVYLPHSTARHLVRCATAALVMQYTDSVGSATNPAWELRLMM